MNVLAHLAPTQGNGAGVFGPSLDTLFQAETTSVDEVVSVYQFRKLILKPRRAKCGPSPALSNQAKVKHLLAKSKQA